MEAIMVEGQDSSSAASGAPRPNSSHAQAPSRGHKRRATRPRTPDAEREKYDEEEETPEQELDEVSCCTTHSNCKLYVTMLSDVVGIQYYKGLVGRGECVMLRRQPQNEYDANAVEVG